MKQCCFMCTHNIFVFNFEIGSKSTWTQMSGVPHPLHPQAQSLLLLLADLAWMPTGCSAFITMKNWLKHKHWWANVGFIKDFCSEQYQCSIRSPQIPLLPFCALPWSPPAPLASNSQHLCNSSSENTAGSQIDRPWATRATFPPQWTRSAWGFIPFLHPMLDQWLTSAGVWKPSSPPLVGTTLSWT